jgi:predicted DNA-binding transcriptional regulator YafY
MSLESNIDYKGYNHITPIFNAIVNKTVLKIKYEPFDKEEYEVTFHPFFLKQYNNRWFVFGFNEFNNESQWNLALDRINGEVVKTNSKYKEDKTDWEEFFDDMIGVSKGKDDRPEEVKLIFNKEQAPYILTKPLHSSQKMKVLEDGSLEIRINVIINFELEMRILSYAEKVKVIAPDNLVVSISDRVKKLNLLY